MATIITERDQGSGGESIWGLTGPGKCCSDLQAGRHNTSGDDHGGGKLQHARGQRPPSPGAQPGP